MRLARRAGAERLWLRFGDEAGATAVEMGLLLPLFIFLIFGIVEFGRLLWTQSQLQSAVEAAARCRALNSSSCTTTSATQTYAAAQMTGVAVPAASFAVSSASCGTLVTTSYAFQFLVGQLTPWNMTLAAKSCHP